MSGDYKTADDGLSTAFEPVRCHVFITESTFGLPIYKWQPQEEIYNNVRKWILENKQQNKTSVLIAYSLGKTQRLLKALTTQRNCVSAWSNLEHAPDGTAGFTLPAVEESHPKQAKKNGKAPLLLHHRRRWLTMDEKI